MQDKGARYLYNKAFWKTLGTVGLLTLAVSVLGVCFTVAFWSLARASIVGRPTPREATCAALIAGGPQDNAHLIVTKFRDDAQKTVGFTAVPGKDGAWALAYVPLVPDTDDQPRANDVRIVLKSHRARDARELEQLLASESLQGCLLAPALVLPQSNRGQQVLSEAALLRTIAPAIDPNRCWILDVSAEPVSLADDSLWFPLLIGTALFAIAAFNIGRGFDVPRSARGLMIWIGVAALVSVWGWFFVLFYPRGAAVWNGLAPVAGLVFAQAGAGFVLGPTTRWSWAWLKRASQQQLSNTDRVQATETGFLIDDVRYPHELRDERVRGLAAHNDCHYVEQDLHSYTRRITIWFELADKIQEVATEHTLRLGEDDPLGGLFQRLLERLVAPGLASVKQGRVVDGDGWKLDKSGIAIESEVGKYLLVAEISRVEWRDDELCVWRSGDVEAILRVPAGARNAHLLDRLLEDLVDELAAGGSQTSVNEMESGDLGRMLHERRKRLGQFAVELIASAVVVVLLFDSVGRQSNPTLRSCRVRIPCDRLLLALHCSRRHGDSVPRARHHVVLLRP